MSRASRHPFTNPAHSLIPSTVEVSYRISSSVRARSSSALPSRDLEKHLEATALALGALTRRRSLLGLLEALLGLLESLLEIAAVELVGRDRLRNQDARTVREHLQPALALRVALRLGLRDVQAQLRRHQAGEHRRVPSEDANLADRGAGGQLDELAAEHLALGRQHLGLELVVLGGQGGSAPLAVFGGTLLPLPGGVL